MNCALLSRVCIIIGLAALWPAVEKAADARRLTLTEAVHLALTQNRALKIARLRFLRNSAEFSTSTDCWAMNAPFWQCPRSAVTHER